MLLHLFLQDTLGSYALTLIDSLDSIALMGERAGQSRLGLNDTDEQSHPTWCPGFPSNNCFDLPVPNKALQRALRKQTRSQHPAARVLTKACNATSGNASEFAKAVNWATAHLSFDINDTVSVFETNIRVLGPQGIYGSPTCPRPFPCRQPRFCRRPDALAVSLTP